MRGAIQLQVRDSDIEHFLHTRAGVEKGEEQAPVFELLVPDVQAAKRELIAAGCAIVEEDPSVPRCYIRDPYGVVFNLGRRSS